MSIESFSKWVQAFQSLKGFEVDFAVRFAWKKASYLLFQSLKGFEVDFANSIVPNFDLIIPGFNP